MHCKILLAFTFLPHFLSVMLQKISLCTMRWLQSAHTAPNKIADVQANERKRKKNVLSLKLNLLHYVHTQSMVNRKSNWNCLYYRFACMCITKPTSISNEQCCGSINTMWVMGVVIASASQPANTSKCTMKHTRNFRTMSTFLWLLNKSIDDCLFSSPSSKSTVFGFISNSNSWDNHWWNSSNDIET